MDTQFEVVINECRNIKRKNQKDTWISDDLINVFIEIHDMGLAHSVEVLEGEELIGGLYGLALGKIFFGESMFSLKSNASKYAFITLVQYLKENNFSLIDCQQETSHLKSLGARVISKESFYKHLKRNTFEASKIGSWQFSNKP